MPCQVYFTFSSDPSICSFQSPQSSHLPLCHLFPSLLASHPPRVATFNPFQPLSRPSLPLSIPSQTPLYLPAIPLLALHHHRRLQSLFISGRSLR